MTLLLCITVLALIVVVAVLAIHVRHLHTRMYTVECSLEGQHAVLKFDGECIKRLKQDQLAIAARLAGGGLDSRLLGPGRKADA